MMIFGKATVSFLSLSLFLLDIDNIFVWTLDCLLF